MSTFVATRDPMGPSINAGDDERLVFIDRGRSRLGGHAIIFSVATVFALATAIECQSVTHLPSLNYGLALWEWWGCIASAIWILGRRIPFASNFSGKAIAVHSIVAATLGAAHLLLLGRTASIRVYLWNCRNSAVSDTRAARRDEVARIGEAAFRCALACSADAVGTAFSIQYIECNYDPGRT